MASPIELLRAFETGSVENRSGWTNVAFDAHLSQLTREGSAMESAQALEEVTQILEVKDPGVLPLGYPTQPMLLGQRVVSFAITPFGDPDLVKIQLKQ
jgi:ABC-type oligopeptide transport system substrate-binding subunit